MELQVTFAFLTISLCLYLAPAEAAGKVIYVPLPDDQCIEWKELSELDYEQQINVPITRIGEVVTDEADESLKCAETKDIREPCTCMESVGLDPNGVNKYKKLDEVKPHPHHKVTDGSESIEYDDSNEFNYNRQDKHHKADEQTPIYTNSFSEEFSGSDEDIHMKPSKKDTNKHKDGNMQKDKAQDEVHNEDYVDTETGEGQTALEKSASYSYEDSQAGSHETGSYGPRPK